MSIPKRSRVGGKILVIAMLLAAVAGSGFTWWNYTKRNPSSSDAVLYNVPTKEPPYVPISPEPAVPQASAAEALAEAEAEARILGEALESSHKAIEEAVVMVREQKENFEFAEDRYEKLMPLVETGALEPLAASQIQSAYISARAGFAQAKYFLAQARRDYGSEESRRWRVLLARKRVDSLRKQLAEESLSAAAEEASSETDSLEAPMDFPFVEAFFPHDPEHPLLPGMSARITLPPFLKNKMPAKVETVQATEWPAGQQADRVLLRFRDSLPPELSGRKTIPCYVTIDTTGPQPVLSPATD